jgi:biopolymer transport protein ExbB
MLANVALEFFHNGGPIMYPILVVAVVAVCITLERFFWWSHHAIKRDNRLIAAIYHQLQENNPPEAMRLASDSKDPVVRMIHKGLSHPDNSMEGALQVASGHELRSAGKFLSAMDTIVTLGPLLGLLGTVTGIMGSFSSIGSAELAVEKVTGGIGEALIATAAGLGIAIYTLIPMNYFHGRLASLQFDLETAANNVLILTASNGSK